MLLVDVAKCRKGGFLPFQPKMFFLGKPEKMPEAVVPVRLVACEDDGSKDDELWLFGFSYKDNNNTVVFRIPL